LQANHFFTLAPGLLLVSIQSLIYFQHQREFQTARSPHTVIKIEIYISRKLPGV